MGVAAPCDWLQSLPLGSGILCGGYCLCHGVEVHGRVRTPSFDLPEEK